MKKALLISVLFVIVMAMFQPIPTHANSKIDIVFIYDSSNRMTGTLSNVKKNIQNFVSQLDAKGIEYRLALAGYTGFTTNVNDIINNLYNFSSDINIKYNLALIDSSINFYSNQNNSTYFVFLSNYNLNYYDQNTTQIDSTTLTNGSTVYSNSTTTTTTNTITVTSNSWDYYNLPINDIMNIIKAHLDYNKITLITVGFPNFTGGTTLDLTGDFSNDLFNEIQAVPSITSVIPLENQYLSEQNTTFVPTVKVSDPDSDTLTVRYYLDDETTPRDTKIITNTITSQIVSFNALDLENLSEGNHQFTFTLSDGSYTVKNVVDVIVDRTAPNIKYFIQDVKDISATFYGNASDSYSGIVTNPYRYTLGTITSSSWINNNSYTFNGLNPNTTYDIAFEARDNSGHIAKQTKKIVTQAQKSTISVVGSSESSLDIGINDRNPEDTLYQCKVNAGYTIKYIDASGDLIATPVWIQPQNKIIKLKGLNPNNNYGISVYAKNTENVSTLPSNYLNAMTLALPPTDITTESQLDSITIQWTMNYSVNGYDIEVDGQVINLGRNNSYTHQNLNSNTLHTYKVRTINGGGAGNWGQPITLATLTNPPQTPTIIGTNSFPTKISISWDNVANTDKYEIEADGLMIDNGINTTYVQDKLLPLTEHTYRVRAENKGGVSEWSSPITVKTLPYPPAVPTNIKADPTVYTVSLTWDQDSGTDSYEIEVDGQIMDNGTSTTYLHDGLDPSSGHTYRVRAVNLGGKSTWSNPVDITTYPEKPSIPSNIMTTGDQNFITVNWYKVGYADSYDIEIDGSRTENVTDTYYIDKGLEPNSTHTYRIRARNVTGISDWSSPVTMTTMPDTTNSTTSLTNVIAVVTNNDITLSWDAVAYDAQYDIEVDGKLLDNGKETIYHQGGLEPNQYHSYKIRVRTKDGTSDWVAVLSLSTLPNPPDAPKDIIATANNYSIELNWSKVEGTTGYDIEIDGKTIDTINNSSYTDENLTPGTSHTYRVRAKNVTGVTAWSPAIIKSTTSPTYLLKGIKDESFDFSILASSVQDFSELKFIVTYDSTKLDIVDLYGFTPTAEQSSGDIKGTNLHVNYEPGKIEFTVNQNIVPGTTWSGEISTIIFKSKIDGDISIDYEVQ